MSDLKDNEIKITSVPHSGNLGLEFPVNDFDNTSLAEADSQGFITVPDTANLTEAPTPHERIVTKTPEKVPSENPIIRFFQSRRNQLISAGTGVVLLATGTTAAVVNANSQEEIAAPPAATGEPFTPAPEVTPATSETPAAEMLPENLVQYKEMTPEQFAGLPKAEQALYVSYLFRNFEQFVNDWRAQKEMPYDIYVPASATNKPQEATANATWGLRYTASLDLDSALKATGFLLYDGVNSVDYQEWVDTINERPGRPVQGMAEGELFPVPTVENPSVTPTQVNGITVYENLQFTYRDGTGSTGNLYFGEYPSYNNGKFGFWGQINR